MKIVNIVGARPNFMKIAPIMAAYKAHPEIDPVLVHTGQHYDERMSDLFFRQLGIPEPDMNLEVGSGSHATVTAEIMKRFEPVVLEHKPDCVLVVGDVNSTVACGMVAVKLGVRLAHVEAGLRSHDRSMPEEINRLLTDVISDLLFCTEPSGVENLQAMGVPDEKIHFVGNVMIDTLMSNLDKAKQSTVLDDLGLVPRGFAVLTLHRPSNVDDPATFKQILDALEVVQQELTIVFPIHPRTRKNLADTELGSRMEAMPNMKLVEPAAYLDFLRLMSGARLVLSDSGGIQEETTILKVPCLTLRENTERPITLEVGSNQLVGTDTGTIIEAYRKVMDGRIGESAIPELWDGHAAERIVNVLAGFQS